MKTVMMALVLAMLGCGEIPLSENGVTAGGECASSFECAGASTADLSTSPCCAGAQGALGTCQMPSHDRGQCRP